MENDIAKKSILKLKKRVTIVKIVKIEILHDGRIESFLYILYSLCFVNYSLVSFLYGKASPLED